MKRILIIDDDPALCESMAEYLLAEGFAATEVHDGDEGLQMALSGDYALAVLDIMMPSIDGFQVLQEIRSQSNMPVLMITGCDRVADRIEALETGADDYLQKPFDLRELAARIRAILRRTEPNFNETRAIRLPERIVVGDIEVLSGMRIAYRQGRPVELTSVEFDLLETLLRAAGRIISREELAERALGRALGLNDRSIDVHISSLRKKLGKHFSGIDRIRTVRNSGYLYTRSPRPFNGG